MPEKTQLDNIPFGKDQPGGGSSNEPYITNPRGFQWSPGNVTDGVFIDGVTGAATGTEADLLRITKWLADNPLFVARQVGLQLSNPQLEHREDRKTDKPTSGQGFFNNTIDVISNTANRITNDIGPTRTYSPLNLLAQVGSVAFSQHFVRHGFSPVMDEKDKYEYIVRENNENGNNRLVKLAKQLADPETAIYPLMTYKGGPNSAYGIGDTVIRRADRVDSFTSFDNTEEKRTKMLKSFIPISMQKIFQITEEGTIETATTMVLSDGSNGLELDTFDFTKQDYRIYKNSIKQSDQRRLPTVDSKNNIETRIGTARSRTSAEYQHDYTVPVIGSSDKISALGLYYSDVANQGTAYTSTSEYDSETINDDKVRDLVKFRIKALDNDHPGSGVYMVFRAFLNDVNRRIDAKWNGYSYIGRGETFYTYDGFSNVMSLEFTVAAMSRREMKPLYQKLNYLHSTLTPDYKANKMRGNLMELTVGDYIKYQPGIITSMYMGIPQEANWDIALNEPDAGGVDKDMHELPMLLKIGINFIPLWNFLPRKSAEAPFFGIDDTEKPGQISPKSWTYGMDQLIKAKKV